MDILIYFGMGEVGESRIKIDADLYKKSFK